MSSTDVIARDQVLADLAALGAGTSDAISLLSQARDLAKFADQVQGELARLAGIIDATGAYAAAGYTSAAAFLRHGCGRSPGRAGELVATGRALRHLEATGQAMAAGRVSFDAAHVICRAAGQIEDDATAAAAEQAMLAAATTGLPGSRSAAEATGQATDGPADPAPGEPTAPHTGADRAQPGDHRGWAPPGLDPRELRRLGEDLTYRADPDAVEERQRKRFERRYLSFGLTLDDVSTISGACSDTLSMEIIKTAVEAFSPPGGTGDTRTAAQRRMDGLTAACQAALDSGAAGSHHGAMPHLTILLDTDPATGHDHHDPAQPGTSPRSRPGTSPAEPATGPGPARTGHGALLTARQILTLACRAEISAIRWRDGLPLDVGRRYRTETPALRRALTARDRGCRWPGCGLPATWTTAHHIRPWKHGGATRLSGLVLLCFVHHHYFIHLYGWTITGTPDTTLHFTHPNRWLTLDSPLPGQTTSRSP